MLDILTQADPAGMRTNRYSKLGRQQQNSQHFINPAQTHGVNLAKTNSLCLQQLLEDDAVLNLFAGGHANGGNGASNGSVAQYIIRAVGSSIHSGLKRAR